MDKYKEIIRKINIHHGKDGKFCTAEEDAGGFNPYDVFMEALNDKDYVSPQDRAKQSLKKKVEAHVKTPAKIPKEAAEPVEWDPTGLTDEEKVQKIKDYMPFITGLSEQMVHKIGADKFYQVENSYKHGNEFLNMIQKKLGFDGNPLVVTDDEYDTIGNKEYYRGFKDAWSSREGKTTMTGKEKFDQFMRGEHFTGKGVYGDGTYVSRKFEMALSYTTKNNDGTRSPILAMKMLDGTAFADFSQIMKESAQAIEFINSISDDGMSSDVKTVATKIIRDYGVYAAVRGYDGYDAFDDVTLILNNTKIAVKEENAEGI